MKKHYLLPLVSVTLMMVFFSASCGVLKKTSSASKGSSAENSGTVEGTPTGGTITSASGYTIHTFTSSDTFVLPSARTLEYLVVGGGGGGGDGNSAGGGGGGGGVVTGTITLPAGTYSVVIGQGGLGASVEDEPGLSGEDSSFGGIIARGGGGGGGYVSCNGASGGSGGGGAGPDSDGIPCTHAEGSSSQTAPAGGIAHGFAGAPVTEDSQGNVYGGGGGGAGAAATGVDGGIGFQSDISGTLTYYAGGGGGGDYGDYATLSPGNGGLGGGGAGAIYSAPDMTKRFGVNGTPNTGGGGGGSSDSPGDGGSGGQGGSGIVIIRY